MEQLKIKLEKKKYIRRRHGKNTILGKISDALNRMAVGTSFKLNRQYYTSYWVVQFEYDFKDKHFITRTEDKDFIRVYRIK